MPNHVSSLPPESARSAGQGPVILLVAEAVTLAHFARIATLAEALHPGPWRVQVAADPRYAALAPALADRLLPLRSISGAAFTDALTRGRPLYDEATLAAYVEDDLELLDRVRPDLVVGDFRLSLAVSAPLRGIPYAALVNAYWSPYAELRYPVPDLPVTRLLGAGIGQVLFDLARPLAFALHARPLNRLRRRFGLPALGADLRHVYTWGDQTWYADLPELIPTRPLPPHHRHIGPVLWSARAPLPPWWRELPEDRPIVCVTLGSSGRADMLPAILDTLARLPVTVVAATLGQQVATPLPDNVFLADYLPLAETLARSRLLVCNGGSLSTYQAMAAGIACIGLGSNLDQMLNMAAVRRLGCGLGLRAANLSAAALRAAVLSVLDDPAPAEAARRMGRILQGYDSPGRFRAAVADMLR
ncbi:MAG: UDP-glucoronosyl and UDP-glucosyltransferase family protein [bacterium]|nr:MAG: UDP-glucoronosyl and UDP-glucosyltransferase family protein [bacterium]KAF0150172.1 MAG: UDP-glucoronosyl and UDP-glucosyltransferase family protein [bacterium]KAF0169652.1 MAG: UDP-glucoronosyl and UDP-glucosyltransferase family protein [bacterium]TXT22956.1 MAG: UDP-glucoronosyl and UDP-glucosyltransferase family protein [bacterium]